MRRLLYTTLCLALVACGGKTGLGVVIDDADASSDGAVSPCPLGLPGPRLVPILGQNACIDATEVTNADYESFVAAPFQARTGVCADKTTHVPTALWPPKPADLALPVVNVDWCDAAAYCEWAHKRLCAQVDGTSGDLTPARVATGLWTLACAGDARRSYPYGDTYDPTACNTLDAQRGGPAAAGSFPRCNNGNGTLDLSGNVWEWEDDCDLGARLCAVRGGSFRNDRFNDTCQGHYAAPLRTTYDYYGFRCCSRSP